MGDDVDNIPGVPGIGEKTAAELIKKFGSLEKLIENMESIKQDKIKKAIKDNLKRIQLNQELVTLKDDVDIDFSLEKFKIGKPNYKELARLFKYFEFRTLFKDLPLEEDEPKEIKVTGLEEEDLKEMLHLKDELVLYGQDSDNIVFYAKNKFFKLNKFGVIAKEILSNPDIRKIGHDLKKIKVNLTKDGINLEGLFFDTMIAAYLLNPSQSANNLTDVAWDYLDKTVGPKSLDSRYAVDLILGLRPKLQELLRDKSLFGLFTDLEMPLVEVLAQMELAGIKLDLKVLGELSKDLEKRLIKLIEDIYEISGCQFNINSPKQLRGILFEKLKLPVIKKSKTGPSTDEEVLKNLSGKHKLPALLLEYRQLAKLKSTYIDTLPELIDPATDRIHTSFNQTATETGRLSSSNPNLQNIPIKTEIGKNIRRAIIAFDKDSHLLSCDYSQIELRILAHLSKDKNLISSFKKDKDVHRTTAFLIYGLDEKDVTEQMREVAKRVNFGIIYGLSAYGLSKDLGISLEEAQGFIDAYFVRYPEVKEYIQEQIAKAKKDGFVTTILGRRRYILEINNKNQGIRQFAERQAVNTPIQGSASDLIKLAMVEIHNQIKIRKLKGSMILQIHDELVFDVPTQEIKEFINLIKDRMENVLKLDVPIRVDIKMGKNWLEMKEVK
jgi:DNA polymerase-1